MMRRRLTSLTALLVLSACSTADTVAPPRPRGADGASFTSAKNGKGGAANHRPLVCGVDAPLQGSAVIGPKGGTLQVGPHLLIIPPGALITETLISGSIPAGSSIEIDFQPSGLQFKKPAGLVLDASACGNVPDVLYLNDKTGIDEPIPAVFSNWWHTVAAPIEHFSYYMLEV